MAEILQEQSASEEKKTSPEKRPCLKRLVHNAYTIGWVCALPKEQTAARAMLDEEHEPLPIPRNDHNVYTLGSICKHNIVIACLPNMGTNSAATTATSMINTFPSIRFGLMVGIGGGIPMKVFLGDVVVSQPVADYHGVVQWDMGRLERDGQFVHTGSLNRPPNALLNASNQLKVNHEMYGSKINEYLHNMELRFPRLAPKYTRRESLKDPMLVGGKVDQTPTKVHFLLRFWHMIIASIRFFLGLWVIIPAQKNEQASEPTGSVRTQREVKIHYGLIASGNKVIKDSQFRDSLDKAFGGHVLCVEMEAAGLMNDFPCIVIRGICDYANTGKEKSWQEYAAAVAAAYAKELLGCVHPSMVDTEEAAKNILEKVERYTQETRDTLSILQSQFDQNIGWQNLRIIQGALFDSYDNEHEECLKGTRTNLLNEVETWVKSRDKKCIFWLNGMAGTGKSTIAQTIARRLNKRGELGATFFFKRGEADRGNAKYFISTLARQLIIKHQELASYVLNAIKRDSNLVFKSLDIQFDELIYQPLERLCSDRSTTVIIIIDALDECDRDQDLQLILHCLFKMQEVESLHLRVFLTSRPELPIRYGFYNHQKYRDLILHELPKPVIEHDIRVFLEYKFAEIRDKHPSTLRYPLSPDWPGDDNIERLVHMAVPLFIFAATLCRFVGDPYESPDERLQSILKDKATASTSDMERTYRPILNQLLAATVEHARILQDFYDIVGVIILLATPLSVNALAQLTGINEKRIASHLQRFYSILNVPADPEAPVRILHLSFRDYLLAIQSPFYIDAQATHEKIAWHCLQLMNIRLKDNICELSNYGTEYKDIEPYIINKQVTADLKYACRYWVHHLEQSKGRIADFDILFFLKKHFLHWLEVLALIGGISEAVGLIDVLKAQVWAQLGSELSDFLFDAGRFIRQNSYMAAIAPLQIYRAGLVFAPTKSIINQTFYGKVKDQLAVKTGIEHSWSSNLQTIEGHSNTVRSVAFSPDGRILASGADDNQIKLWDTTTGVEQHILTGHSNTVRSVAFSPDGYILASGAADNTIKLWKTATGIEQYTLTGHSYRIQSVVFSPDGCILASGAADGTIKLWNTATGVNQHTLTGHLLWIQSVTFSPDGCILASGSADNTIKLWNIARGVERCTLTGHPNTVQSVAFSAQPVAFSPDGRMLASGADYNTFKLWETATGVEQHTLTGYSDWISSVVNRSNINYSISVTDSWVYLEGERVLWLPTNYRSFNCFAIKDTTLALGLTDGRVLIVQCKFL